MTAKKTAAARKPATSEASAAATTSKAPAYRVLRAFREGGVYYSNDAGGKIASLPKAVLQDRLDRGFIQELQPRSADTAAAPPAEE